MEPIMDLENELRQRAFDLGGDFIGVADLLAGEPAEERCGTCRQCVDTCPVQAFTNRNFQPEEPREVRDHARKRRDYLHRNYHIPEDETVICEMCVYSCPFGQRDHRSEEDKGIVQPEA